MTEGVLDVKDVTIFLDIANNGTFVAAGCATDAQLEVTKELREILCKQNAGGPDYKPSILRWTGSISGLLAYDATMGGINLVDICIAGTKIKIRFGTDETGDTYYEGEAYISGAGFSSSGGSGDNVTYNGSFQGLGVPVKGVNA